MRVIWLAFAFLLIAISIAGMPSMQNTLCYFTPSPAAALSSTGFLLTSTFGLSGIPAIDSTVVQSLTLVTTAGGYAFQVGAGGGQIANFRWNIDLDGKITFDTAFDGYLSGRGTETLQVDGYPVTTKTGVAPAG